MDIETAEAVDTLRTDIHRVEREVVRVETSLTATMRELNEDAKRHTDVQVESVRVDIRILAEGFASLSVTVGSLSVTVGSLSVTVGSLSAKIDSLPR